MDYRSRFNRLNRVPFDGEGDNMDVNYRNILQYYVLGYDFNKKQVYRANIFNNIYVYSSTVELIEKYLKDRDFEAFHKDLINIVKYEMMSRFQYEISVGEPFPKDLQSMEKLDFFYQFELNSYQVAKYIVSAVEGLE